MKEFFKRLTESIDKHDRIFLMTHHTPDLDGMGSAIAFRELMKKMDKECYIVAPKNLINKSLIKSIDYLEKNDIMIPFIYENSIEVGNDLLIVFDTQEKKLVECEQLIKSFKDIVIIDHHSMGIDLINSTYSYLDDSKSSTIEIVCEYLEYLNISLDKYFSTVMFAGLYVDTNGFTLKTTPRTFEIASFLLKNGADNLKWQFFLKNSMEDVLNIYSYIENSVKLYKDIYLCVVDDKYSSSIELAMIANKMLKFEGVRMAFVVGMSDASTVLISSRSNGEIDVSKIMMKFGGGGHFSSAASQIASDSIDHVISELKKYLREV